MAWITVTALRSFRAEAQARQQAAFEENIQLALWRMDSFLADLLAQEGSHLYFYYTTFYKAESAYTRMFEEIKQGEILIPSPLLTQVSPYILLHFQFDPHGNLSSPQIPAGNMRDLAEARYTTSEKIDKAAERLKEFCTKITRDALLAALVRPGPQPVSSTDIRITAQADGASSLQRQRIANEWQARYQNVQQATSSTTRHNIPVQPSSNLRLDAIRPVWAGGALVLARQVSINGENYIQGSWLNWTALKSSLLAGVKDLLQEADLQMAENEQPVKPSRMLAALPVKLVPGSMEPQKIRLTTPVFLSLGIAWVCVMLSALAAVLLLKGTVSLGERRGAFVSAVTHELRSPLTTFRLYTEMLAEGMIQDEEKRQSYLKTLCAEADRLSRLVENVLSYARLEQGSATNRIETVTLQELLNNAGSRLAERAEKTNMKLLVEGEESDLSVAVRTDTSAVEQILFNLVENACKYAASASDRSIHLQVSCEKKFALLRVRDHGPGISKSDARHLFHPFRKPGGASSRSAQGVGLGLALSRSLACQLGGNLRLDKSVRDGACFALSLPLA